MKRTISEMQGHQQSFIPNERRNPNEYFFHDRIIEYSMAEEEERAKLYEGIKENNELLKAYINEPNELHQTPFGLAVEHGLTELVELFLEDGWNPNVSQKMHDNPNNPSLTVTVFQEAAEKNIIIAKLLAPRRFKVLSAETAKQHYAACKIFRDTGGILYLIKVEEYRKVIGLAQFLDDINNGAFNDFIKRDQASIKESLADAYIESDAESRNNLDRQRLYTYVSKAVEMNQHATISKLSGHIPPNLLPATGNHSFLELLRLSIENGHVEAIIAFARWPQADKVSSYDLMLLVRYLASLPRLLYHGDEDNALKVITALKRFPEAANMSATGRGQYWLWGELCEVIFCMASTTFIEALFEAFPKYLDIPAVGSHSVQTLLSVTTISLDVDTLRVLHEKFSAKCADIPAIGNYSVEHLLYRALGVSMDPDYTIERCNNVEFYLKFVRELSRLFPQQFAEIFASEEQPIIALLTRALKTRNLTALNVLKELFGVELAKIPVTAINTLLDKSVENEIEALRVPAFAVPSQASDSSDSDQDIPIQLLYDIFSDKLSEALDVDEHFFFNWVNKILNPRFIRIDERCTAPHLASHI